MIRSRDWIPTETAHVAVCSLGYLGECNADSDNLTACVPQFYVDGSDLEDIRRQLFVLVNNLCDTAATHLNK